MPRKTAANGRVSLARLADRHALYERSVQDCKSEVRFVTQTFKKLRGRKPLTVREDFGGTGKFCYEWVKGDPKRRAWTIDLDELKSKTQAGFEGTIAISENAPHYQSANVETRTVDIHIVGLRRKVEPNPSDPTLIQTVRGKGYRWYH